MNDYEGWQTVSEPGPIHQVQDHLEELMAPWRDMARASYAPRLY